MLNTKDYKDGVYGEGPEAEQWADKPHRLVYDLCGEIDRLRKELRATAAELYTRSRQAAMIGTQNAYHEAAELIAALAPAEETTTVTHGQT